MGQDNCTNQPGNSFISSTFDLLVLSVFIQTDLTTVGNVKVPFLFSLRYNVLVSCRGAGRQMFVLAEAIASYLACRYDSGIDLLI